MNSVSLNVYDKITVQLYVEFFVVTTLTDNTHVVLGPERPYLRNVCFICYFLFTSFSFVCFRGKNVLNQKSELEKALSKHKEKQIMNQVKEHRETPGNPLTYNADVPFIT